MRRINTYRRTYNNDGSTQTDNDRKRVENTYQAWPGYLHAGDYLKYIKPRLQALRTPEAREGDRAQEWQRDFKKALHTRITLKGAALPRGRKWDSDNQRAMMRDCRAIQDRAQRRICLYQIMTPELQDRFSHLISEREY